VRRKRISTAADVRAALAAAAVPFEIVLAVEDKLAGDTFDLDAIRAEVVAGVVDGANTAFALSEDTEVGPITRWITRGARRWADAWEQRAGLPLWLLYLAAEMAPGLNRAKREPTPELFGYYRFMQAAGHGVTWDDSFPPSLLEARDVAALPYAEPLSWPR